MYNLLNASPLTQLPLLLKSAIAIAFLTAGLFVVSSTRQNVTLSFLAMKAVR